MRDTYYKLTESDCLEVATDAEKSRLTYIHDFYLMVALAKRWCSKHGYELGGYLGDDKWDATRVESDG